MELTGYKDIPKIYFGDYKTVRYKYTICERRNNKFEKHEWELFNDKKQLRSSIHNRLLSIPAAEGRINIMKYTSL